MDNKTAFHKAPCKGLSQDVLFAALREASVRKRQMH